MEHSRSPRRRVAAFAATAVVVAGLSGTAAAAPLDPAARERAGLEHQASGLDVTPRHALEKVGRQAFLLKVSGRSTYAAYSASLRRGKPAARSAARQQLASVRAAQDRVAADLPRGSKVLYRTHAALNAVAVTTDARNYADLQRIDGVVKVYPIAAKEPSNGYAVPLVGGDTAWQNTGNTGEGTTIAIIDTGLDYTHANFGGPGTTAAYDAEHANEDQPANPAYFPSDKIIGGFDFAGDLYDAGAPENPGPGDPTPIPAPDDNPLDCNGHGSHVGGTAAGLGVEADGSTYDGQYDASTPFDDLKIGPGVAPGAQLLAYRVFGCDGSSNVTGAALDRAADPNNDGDPSDAVDVVNLSLGTDFGSPLDGDSVLTNELAEMGITMAVASGNGGDVFDVGGSPGNAPRSIAVANSVDEYSQLDALSVTAPVGVVGDYGAQRSIAYDWAADPDLAGTVARVSDPANAEGCDTLSPVDAAAVAGKIAWVEWTNFNGVFECGSVARAENLAEAGAVGFIFASDVEVFNAGITGSAEIPGVIITDSAADTLRASATAGTLTVGGTTANGFRSIAPGINDQVNSSSSRNSREEGGIKPDVTAVGTTIFSTGVGTGTEGSNSSGTSMATPMVAGLAALVTAEHPTWTAEEVKADIMNTAGQDLFSEENHTGTRFAPNRVGAGRIVAPDALRNDVLAYVADDPGSVSVSFGPLEVTKATTLSKTVKVANKGGTAASYAASYQALTTIPGVTYTVSPTSVSVPAGGFATVTVTLKIDPKLLTKTIDPTMEREQGSDPREYLADASGRVVLDAADARPNLRVPVYSAPRPASSMSQPAALGFPAGSVATANLPLTGTGIDQGEGAELVESLVSAYELQAESPLQRTCEDADDEICVHNADERASDLKYVGASSAVFGPDPIADGYAYFAITTHGPWYTAASQTEFDILIDTDGDGTPDFVTFNTRFTDTDVLVSATFDLTSGENVDVWGINDRFGDRDTALFDSDTMVIPVWLGALGIDENSPRINYAIEAYSNQAGRPVDFIGYDDDFDIDGSLTLDVVNPGVSTGPNEVDVLFPDRANSTLPITWNRAEFAEDGGLGALVVHHHNKVGNKAQVVKLRAATSVGLALTPTTVQAGLPSTATVTVANTGGAVPTGAVTLRSGSRTLASGTLDGAGKAVMAFKALPAGTHSVVAHYAGDAVYAPTSSAAKQLTVNKIAPTVKLKLPKRAEQGEKVTAVIRVPTVNGVTPTGKVSVKLGKKTLKSGTLTDGKAKIRFRLKREGTFRLYAKYAGDANYTSGKSIKKRIRVV